VHTGDRSQDSSLGSVKPGVMADCGGNCPV
jgi:hypothetical protein